MAIHQIQTMSGGAGSEVVFEYNDATGALNCQVGNDRGSPTVNVGVEYQDGTTDEWTQPTKTVREIEYDAQGVQPKIPAGYTGTRPKAKAKPKARANEVIAEESAAEPFDELGDDGKTVVRKRVRQRQRFRRKQAGKANKASLVDVLDDQGQPTGDKTLDFVRTWRQEVY